MSILKLLANGNFITVNKCVAKSIGLNESVILGALCSEFVYCEGRGSLTDDGFFPFSVNALQEETTIGEKPQKVAITNLIKAGILEQKNFGQPQVRHFKINEESVADLLENRPNDGFKTANREELKPPIGTNYISNKYRNKVSNKVEEDYYSSTQVTESMPPQDEIIHRVIESWNRQKNIRTTIDRIAPLSKRYNDTFLCIAQFGYETFLYEILSLDNNHFFEEWQPSYDWFCDPNNFNKVYDGNYRNKTGKKEIDWENL